MTASRTATAGRFTGWHMLGLAFAFFGVIIAVNVLLAVLSVKTWTGQVVDDSYMAGQEFEANRLDHEAQQAAGWSSRFVYSSGLARLTVTDAAGGSVDLGTVTLSVRRPIGDREDHTLPLARTPAGTYEAHLDLPAGVWIAIVSAPHTEKGVFELDDRFRVEGGS